MRWKGNKLIGKAMLWPIIIAKIKAKTFAITR